MSSLIAGIRAKLPEVRPKDATISQIVHGTPTSEHPPLEVDEKFPEDKKVESEDQALDNVVFASVDDLPPELLDDNGKEKVVRTAHDFSTRLISLEDDPSMPVLTFRFWVLALSLTAFGSALGQIFYFRPQTYSVSAMFIQIISFVLGKAWEKGLPKADRGKFWKFVNPGPFNIKEHTCILIMAGTGSGGALAISAFAAEKLYYDINPGYALAIFTLMGSQLMGYGLAGLCRSFTTYPTYILFPGAITVANLFDALHRHHDSLGQKKRIKFFWTVLLITFVWEWIPQYLAPTLTGISVFCLANQDSAWFTRVFGGSNGNEGLGVLSLSLDWQGVGLFQPFSTPIATTLSLYTGVLICIIVSTAAYAGNVWKAQNFPFLSQDLFYENGTRYEQTLILNPDFTLNETALAEQGLPWYAPTNAFYYIGLNLGLGASFMHVFIWHGKEIVAAIREWRAGGPHSDAHYRKMQKYPEVSMWIYAAVFVGSFISAIATLYLGHTGMPWYALIAGVIYACLEFPLVTIISATTGFGLSGGNLALMIGSAIVPGNTRSALYFQLYSSNVAGQGLALATDLKLGQYLAIPPMATFISQMVGTLVGAIVSFALMNSIVDGNREILLDIQGDIHWSGNLVQSYNSEAVTWGGLGKTFYGPNSQYFVIPISVVAGLLVPLPFYFLHKYWPKRRLDTVVTPIFCWGLGYLSVGVNSSVFGTLLVAIFSQYYLRCYRPTWFRKYNYILSAALDGGTTLMVFLAAFILNGGAGKSIIMPNYALNPVGNYELQEAHLNPLVAQTLQ